MDLTPRALVRSLSRAGAAAQNAMEIARFGGLGESESSPHELVAEVGIAKVRRYFPSADTSLAPPVLLVPPLMMTAEVWDVSPDTSAVAALARAGLDPWVCDFGSPEHEEGGTLRTLTEHVHAVSDAIDVVREHTGRDVHVGGYSQGGMFCYQAVAYRRSQGIASVVTFGSPVDVHRIVPFGLPEEEVTRWLAALARRLFSGSAVPGWMTRTGFKLLDPVKTVRSRVDFLRQLHDREALIAREPQRRFLDGEGFIAWPGPALAEFFQQFVAHNRMLSGGFQIDDRIVTLADITCPVLGFVGEVDEIAPPPTVRAIVRAAPRADIHEVSLPAGHFGLVVGSRASAVTWPSVAAWVRWCEGVDAELPEGVVPMHPPGEGDEGGLGLHLGYGAELAANVGVGVARSLIRTTGASIRTVRELADDAIETLPRLARLERVSGDTRISLGLVLDEQAKRSPDDTFFLYEDRAHTYADAKRRIDAVVRGLISVGVRQGEHVGVLMATRPSALATVAAISRLGAVAVMLRPDGTIEREAELGKVVRIVADPEHAEAARAVSNVPVLVLGGGADPRDLGAGITDMERIDPDTVRLPAWHAPNPGRARDLAFILFTGRGDATRVNRITNRRWSLSAFGAASAAALDEADTVYVVTPIHHPSGLLTTIGGAVAGGARLALARASSVGTFWEEVRRYGVTVVPYTWTLCRDLVLADVDPNEQHHPIRLFMGSGMPDALWRRVTERFAPASVLEFYASTEGRAVLGNLTGKKVGSKGRPLPGSAEVRIARWNRDTGRLVEGPDGFAQACDVDEPGLLLARADRDDRGDVTTPLRGVFARGDAWLSTGDLFRRDADGDLWMVEHAHTLVRTSDGPTATMPAEAALGTLRQVVLAVVYGRAGEDGPDELAAALQLLPGTTVAADELTAAVAELPAPQRPALVHVVTDVPRTTWYRPRKSELREQAIAARARRWRWDAATGGYVKGVAARSQGA